MYNILNQINRPNDIKNIEPSDYKELAKEIRACLIRNVSNTGGHLASNLGVVELTMAIHLCIDFPEDKLIWDVGHQSYVHKILTGRRDKLGTIRQFGRNKRIFRELMKAKLTRLIQVMLLLQYPQL